MRQAARFFTPYWVDPYELSPLATDLLAARNGVKITGTADDTLGRLADAVDALDARAARHPLTLPVAIAAAKRELSGRTTAITLHDRMHDELSRLRQSQDQTRTGFHSLPEGDSVDLLHERIDESLTTPCGLVATAAYWGNDGTDRWWLSDIERYARPVPGGGMMVLLRSVNIPAAHLLYVAGVAAIAAERFDLALHLLSSLHVTDPNGRRESVAYWRGTPGWVYADSRAGREAPNKRVFDLHTPTFVQHLGLGLEVYQDAWETFELLRLIETTYQIDSAAADIDAIVDAHSQFDRQDRALRTAQSNGANAEPARVERAEAWKNLDRSLGHLSRLVSTDQPHVRVAADYSDEHRSVRLFPPVIGQQLLADLRRAGADHPLVLAGFCGGQGLHLEITLEAVNAAIGVQGNQLAYRSLSGQVGTVPDYFWFDTLDRPNR